MVSLKNDLIVWILVVLGLDVAVAGDYRADTQVGPGTLLIARPGMPDPNFAQSVILLIDYGAGGAMGLIINRPSRFRLAQALPDIEGIEQRNELVYLGGPVAQQRIGLLLRTNEPTEESHHVFDDIFFTSSQVVLDRILGRKEAIFHAFAGYAGWGPGQLDGELDRGDWRIEQADSEIIFTRSPEDIWEELIRRTHGTWVKSFVSVNRRT